MDVNTNVACAVCGGLVETTNSEWYAFDVQQEKKQLFFCSPACLSSWVEKKQTSLRIAVCLGVLLSVLLIGEFGMYAFFWLYVPYMIRHLGNRLHRIASAGWFGELITCTVILLGSFTIIYPVSQLMQEHNEYLRIREILRKC